MIVFNLSEDAVLASDDIKDVKIAYLVLLRDKDRFERWSNEAHDRIQELEGELAESKEKGCE